MLGLKTNHITITNTLHLIRFEHIQHNTISTLTTSGHEHDIPPT